MGEVGYFRPYPTRRSTPMCVSQIRATATPQSESQKKERSRARSARRGCAASCTRRRRPAGPSTYASKREVGSERKEREQPPAVVPVQVERDRAGADRKPFESKQQADTHPEHLLERKRPAGGAGLSLSAEATREGPPLRGGLTRVSARCGGGACPLRGIAAPTSFRADPRYFFPDGVTTDWGETCRRTAAARPWRVVALLTLALGLYAARNGHTGVRRARPRRRRPATLASSTD